jgi:hypothetical protein
LFETVVAEAATKQIWLPSLRKTKFLRPSDAIAGRIQVAVPSGRYRDAVDVVRMRATL